jgi:hypothetical protein
MVLCSDIRLDILDMGKLGYLWDWNTVEAPAALIPQNCSDVVHCRLYSTLGTPDSDTA